MDVMEPQNLVPSAKPLLSRLLCSYDPDAIGQDRMDQINDLPLYSKFGGSLEAGKEATRKSDSWW